MALIGNNNDFLNVNVLYIGIYRVEKIDFKLYSKIYLYLLSFEGYF